MRGYLTARGRRTDDVLYAMLPTDPRVPAAPLPAPYLDDGYLVVRPLAEQDAAAVAAACTDPDIQHWIFDIPSPYTLKDAEAFIARSARQLAAGEGVDCAGPRLRLRRAARLHRRGGRPPTRRAGVRRDRLLGEAVGAPPGRSLGGGAPARALGLRGGRTATPGAADVPWQRRLAGARRQARLHAHRPGARLPAGRAGQGPRRPSPAAGPTARCRRATIRSSSRWRRASGRRGSS